MRKENQYIDDVNELNNMQSSAGPSTEPNAKDRKFQSGVAPYTGIHGGKPSWERLPADDMFYHRTVEEHMKDTKSDVKHYVKETNMYERSRQWILDVPQTRYDQLYGANKVDFRGMGIRRHLDPRKPGSEEDIERDGAIVTSASKLGRRVQRKGKMGGLDQDKSNERFYRDYVESPPI